jgi:Flp pilus assembly pilin Flp
LNHFLDTVYCRFVLQFFCGPLLRRFGRDCSGVTAVEYGLIIAAIATAIVGVVFLIGEDILFIFTVIESKLKSRT